MDDLSAEAKQIVDSGRMAMVPPEVVRLRVREAVAARVAGAPAVAGAAAGGSAVKLVVLSGLAIVLAVAGAAVVARQTKAGPSDQPLVAKPVAPAAAPGSVEGSRPIIRELVAPPPDPSPVSPRRRPKTTATPGLAEELALLETARAALHAGETGAALAALDRHRRDVREPQLEREALVLRAEALCAAGDARAGEKILDEVTSRWPAAAGIDAVRSQCRRR